MKTVLGLSWRFAVIAFAVLGGLYLYGEYGPTPERDDEAVALALSDLAAANANTTYSVDPKTGMILDIWQPAPTPPGGVSWDLLEATEEEKREDEDGFIMSTPIFPEQVRELEGQRITVAGWMTPLEAGTTQQRFLLMGYPPGCPFHFHAAPMQFIEVVATTPFPTDKVNAMTVSGVLELSGEDESGIFYTMTASRPG
ncbi:MAG: DUF3299 domain-containing protein [Pseudomonadota bacterium]